MPKRSTKAPATKASEFYLGIDPGKSGGLALIDSKGKILSLKTMPETEADTLFCVGSMQVKSNVASKAGDFSIRSVIESVRGFLGEGTEAPGSAMFNFGWNYGGLRMAMIASGLSFEDVPPQVWQKALKIPSRKKEGRKYKETHAAFKNRLKAKAQQLFPRIYITLATCDALLIAEYCRRKFLGIL